MRPSSSHCLSVRMLGQVVLLTTIGCANPDTAAPQLSTPQAADKTFGEPAPSNLLGTCPIAVLFDRSTGLFSVEWRDCADKPADWIPICTVDQNTRVQGLLLPPDGTPEFQRVVKSGPNSVSHMYGLELASQVRSTPYGWEVLLKQWAFDANAVEKAKSLPVPGSVRVSVAGSPIGPPRLPGIQVPRHPDWWRPGLGTPAVPQPR